MKWSNYNILFYSKKIGYCLHNTRSLCFLSLDKKSYNLFEEIETDASKAKDILNTNEYNYLCENKILVKDYEDEAYISKLEYQQRVINFKSENLGIVFAPTLGCNFACPYCYEQGVTCKKASEQVVNNLINFISNQKQYKSVSLSLTGGEPLLAFDIIKLFITKLNHETDKEISHFAIVTNGSLLNEEICVFLNKYKLSFMQITIDGDKEIHDKTRKLKNNESSYYTIVKNIDMACELMPDCKIMIRTNIGKNNVDSYSSLYKKLKDRWKGKNIIIDPSFILDSKLTEANIERSPLELSPEEKCIFNASLVEQKLLKKETLYPKHRMNCHTCTRDGSYVIDPEGFIYKCWADLGHKDRSIGDVINGVNNYNIVSQYLIGSDKFSDPKCKSCKLLPICEGGCNLYRINYSINKRPYNCCPINEQGLIKMLETYKTAE